MDFLICTLVNAPFMIFIIAADAFFIFCIVCRAERIKQPLKFLFWSLISSTIIFLMSTIVLIIRMNIIIRVALHVVFVSSLSETMNSSVWLYFFYYTQIVPTQRALFIWIKKNIKPIIYCLWFLDKTVTLLDVSSNAIQSIFSFDVFDGFHYNFTMHNDTTYLQITSSKLMLDLNTIAVYIVKAHIVFSLFVMVMSTGSTAAYLSRHMRRMIANGQSLSCPQFRSQVRVTVSGILQGVLFVLCIVWFMYRFNSHVNIESEPVFINFTVISFYMAITLFNLGAGQAVFRQRAEEMWLRAGQWCRGPKVESGQGARS